MSSPYKLIEGHFPVFSGQEQNVSGTRSALPDPTKKLIVCCGCSYTYGHGVSVEDSYPFQLNQLLGPEFQVLNMGRSGYGLKLCIDWYLRYGAPLRPSLGIIQVPDFFRQPFPEVHEDLPIHYTLREGSLRPLLSYSPSEYWRMAGICDALIQADVRRLGDFLDNLLLDSVIPIVLFYQAKRSFLRDLVRVTHQRMNAMLRRKDILSCNVQFGHRHLHHLLDRTHPSAKGYDYVAQAVFKVIPLK